MQLLCNGVFLDMPDSWSLAFKRTNGLFAFDKLSCERTLSFDIPATPKNEQVFGLAKKPQFSGEGMRRKFPCQLQAGSIVLEGFLHVESYDGAYKGVFVTGELIGLQAVKEAGKIKDFLEETDITTLTQNPVSPAVGKASKWSQVAYATETERVRASMRLADIIGDACTQLSIPVPTLPASVEYVRIVPKAMLSMRALKNTIKRTFLAPPSTTIYNNVNLVSVTKRSNFFNVSSAHAFRTITENTGGVDTTTTWLSNVRMLVPLQDIAITFPDTLGNDVFCVTFPSTSPLNEVTFLGGYEFTLAPGKTITGTPLAGRSVTIPHGTPFVLVRYDEYHAVNNPGTPGVWYDAGWELTGDIDVEVTMQGAYETVGTGQVVALQDNLPECSLVDLLKMTAALSGTVLNYTSDSGIVFDSVDIPAFDVFQADGMVSNLTGVMRTFGDWAQHNLILFDGGDSVLTVEALSEDYTIDNANIESRKELQKIPFSEGGVAGHLDGRSLLLIRDASEKDALADADTNGDTMLRVRLLKNAGVQALCNKSTKVSSIFKMAFNDYVRVGVHTLLQVEGVRYVWTDAQWQKDMAKFTLSAI